LKLTQILYKLAAGNTASYFSSDYDENAIVNDYIKYDKIYSQ